MSYAVKVTKIMEDMLGSRVVGNSLKTGEGFTYKFGASAYPNASWEDCQSQINKIANPAIRESAELQLRDMIVILNKFKVSNSKHYKIGNAKIEDVQIKNGSLTVNSEYSEIEMGINFHLEIPLKTPRLRGNAIADAISVLYKKMDFVMREEIMSHRGRDYKGSWDFYQLDDNDPAMVTFSYSLSY